MILSKVIVCRVGSSGRRSHNCSWLSMLMSPKATVVAVGRWWLDLNRKGSKLLSANWQRPSELQEVKRTGKNQGHQRRIVFINFTPSMPKCYIPTTACFQAADVEVQDGFLALAAFRCYCWWCPSVLQEVKRTGQNQGHQRWIVFIYFTTSLLKRYIPTTACFQAADVEVQDGFLTLASFRCYCQWCNSCCCCCCYCCPRRNKFRRPILSRFLLSDL